MALASAFNAGLLLRLGNKIEYWDIYIYFSFNMELPDDILSQIKEFSRPVTRPDWRTLHRMPEVRFLKLIGINYNLLNLPVINSFVLRYETRENNYIYTRFPYNPARIIHCYRAEN